MVVAARARRLELGGVVAALWGAGLDAALVAATPPPGVGPRRSGGRRHLRRGGHHDVDGHDTDRSRDAFRPPRDRAARLRRGASRSAAPGARRRMLSLGGRHRVFCASDLGSRLGAVFAVAKAVATLTQRGEIGPSVSTATGIGRRTACRAARAQTAPPAGTKPQIPPSRRAGQQDDGKVCSPFQVPHLERDPHARPPADRGLWPSTASVARPSQPGLVARPMMGWQSSEVGLVGGRAAEPAVGGADR